MRKYIDDDGKCYVDIECMECGDDIPCKIISDEEGEYPDIPEECPFCGELVIDGLVPGKEDFHADG